MPTKATLPDNCSNQGIRNGYKSINSCQVEFLFFCRCNPGFTSECPCGGWCLGLTCCKLMCYTCHLSPWRVDTKQLTHNWYCDVNMVICDIIIVPIVFHLSGFKTIFVSDKNFAYFFLWNNATKFKVSPFYLWVRTLKRQRNSSKEKFAGSSAYNIITLNQM